jgi:hypothetical protein
LPFFSIPLTPSPYLPPPLDYPQYQSADSAQYYKH